MVGGLQRLRECAGAARRRLPRLPGLSAAGRNALLRGRWKTPRVAEPQPGDPRVLPPDAIAAHRRRGSSRRTRDVIRAFPSGRPNRLEGVSAPTPDFGQDFLGEEAKAGFPVLEGQSAVARTDVRLEIADHPTPLLELVEDLLRRAPRLLLDEILRRGLLAHLAQELRGVAVGFIALG